MNAILHRSLLQPRKNKIFECFVGPPGTFRVQNGKHFILFDRHRGWVLRSRIQNGFGYSFCSFGSFNEGQLPIMKQTVFTSEGDSISVVIEGGRKTCVCVCVCVRK